MTYHLNINKWYNINKESIDSLYNTLLNAETTLFNEKKCSLNQFIFFCYKFSSKENYKYL
jgi:hypothetical protein